MRTAFGIIMLAALLSSAFSFSPPIFLKEGEWEDTSEFAEASDKALEEAFVRGVALALIEEFDLLPEEVSVDAEKISRDTLSADVITVTLSGKAALADGRGIVEYLKANGLCAAAVIELSP
jgi:hypothetical protein